VASCQLPNITLVFYIHNVLSRWMCIIIFPLHTKWMWVTFCPYTEWDAGNLIMQSKSISTMQNMFWMKICKKSGYILSQLPCKMACGSTFLLNMLRLAKATAQFNMCSWWVRYIWLGPWPWLCIFAQCAEDSKSHRTA